MIVSKLRKFLTRYLKAVHALEKKHPTLNAFLILIAFVFIWRGIWGLLDTYFFPDNQTLSYALSALIGFGLLLLDDFKLDEVN
ncbi:MAG: hypothetical protein QY312_01040 [Candidatus Dojkabacteria bacterium]|nr:MAG: hypothetical protein QY312_01040 [Candidatus Dojkabacteria bacterium]